MFSLFTLSLTLLLLSTSPIKSNLTIWLETPKNALRAEKFKEIMREKGGEKECWSNIELYGMWMGKLEENDLEFEGGTVMFFMKQFWNRVVEESGLTKCFGELEGGIKEYRICRKIPEGMQSNITNRTQGKLSTGKLSSLHSTFTQYPYLASNLPSSKLTHLLSLLPPALLSTLSLHRYIISNQQLYQVNYSPQKSTFTQLLLEQIHQLPDIDFIVFAQNTVSEEIIHRYLMRASVEKWERYDVMFEVYREVLRRLPGFMWSKDMGVELERNKLLIPSGWKGKVMGLEEGVEKGRGENEGVGSKMTSLFLFNSECVRRNGKRGKGQVGGNVRKEEKVGDICEFYNDFSMESLLKQYIKTQPSDRRIKYLVRTEQQNILSSSIPWPSPSPPSSPITSSHLLFKQQNNIVEWYFDQIKPNIHYIPLRSDLSDLLQKYNSVATDPDLINTLTQESKKLSTRFTKQRIVSDFVGILREYAGVQNNTGGTYEAVEKSGSKLVNRADYLQGEGQGKEGTSATGGGAGVEIVYLIVSVVIVVMVIGVGVWKLLEFKLTEGLSNMELIARIATASDSLGKKIRNELLSI